MKKIKLLQFAFLILVSVNLSAQENAQGLDERLTKAESEISILKKVKISGYLQAQYQRADTNSAAVVAGGNFAANSNQRFMLRRGRIKATYDGGTTQLVFEMDIIEPSPVLGSANAINIRDFYAKISMPFYKDLSLTTGMQYRPFGFEQQYSSSLNESPELTRLVNNVFPNERDLGAMITLKAPSTMSLLHSLTLKAGLFNGQGIAKNTSGNLDFIGQLFFDRTTKNENISYRIGGSYYSGYVLNGDSNIYSMGTNTAGAVAFVKDYNGANIYSSLKREYFGVDAQITIDNPLGITTLRGEYVAGRQPGTASSSKSLDVDPKVNAVGASYLRDFIAYYVTFIHKIAKTPFQLVARYDMYTPNTKVSGSEITSANKFGKGDISYKTIGVGLNYFMTSNVKFLAYYDMVTNDANVLISGAGYAQKLNIFTLRMQYKF